MAGSSNSTEQLIAQARLGEGDAFVELLTEVGPRLRRAVDAELKAIDQDLDPTQIWNDVQELASRRIAEFQGSTEQDFNTWVERLALHHIRQAVRTKQGHYDTVETSREHVSDQKSEQPDVNATLSPHDLETAEFDPNATIESAVRDIDPSDPSATIARAPGETTPDSETVRLAQQAIKIFGDYEILETIARGGMGVVYKARQRKLNRIVALKMILSGQLAEQKDIERFYAEAEAAAQLRHPNIVGIHEVGQHDGQHFFSMEYIEGQSLSELVREQPLPPQIAAKFVGTISEAMHYAHQAGVLHRDLKPANVLVDRHNEPLVTDFGLAKRTEEQSNLTVAGTVLGTPSYMPPEQAMGNVDAISVRSDVYSLGAILYELLIGKPPFAASNPWETIKQVLTKEPVSPRVVNSSIPVDLETICLKCLHKDPDRRYQSAQDLADELKRFLAGEPILARPIGLVERSVRWCYRNPWPTAALAVLLFAVVGISAALVQTQIARDRARIAQQQAELSRDQLLGAINELFTAWGDVTLLNEPGFEEVRAQLLATASNLYRQMDTQLGDDPKIQHELGLSYFRLGRMMFHLRSYEEARESIEAALRIQRQQVDAQPASETRLHALGESLNLHGNLVEVTSTRSGESADNAHEHLTRAESIYDEAIDVRTKLIDVKPSHPEYNRQLLNSRMNRAMVRQRMGDVLADANKIDEAERAYSEARLRLQEVQQGRRELLETLDTASTARRDVVHDLARGYYNIANVTWWLGDFDATQDHVASAVVEFDKLLADKPDDLANQYDQALCLMLGGDATSEQMSFLTDEQQQEHSQLFANTLQSYERAQATLERLVSGSASVPKYKRALAQVHMRIGDLHFLTQHDQKALAAFQSASDLLTPLVNEYPAYQPLLDQANAGIADAKQFISESAASKPMNHENQPRPGERPP